MSDLLTTITHGNGLVTAAGHDLDYRLTSLQLLNGATLVQGKTYAYADGMNLTSITDTAAATQNVALWHSPSNRLTSADGPWGQTTFSYDPVGNRTYDVNTLNAVTTTRVQWYPANSNRMTDMTENGASFRVFTHDAGGNITQEVRSGAEVFDYTYNNRNRMASVTRNGAAYATYIYNAIEQLVSRNTAAPGGPVGTVHYIYDTDGHLIAEANAATGATTREYVWLPSNDNTNDTIADSILPLHGGGGASAPEGVAPDLPLAVVNVSATPVIYQVHTDHLGRPTRMTDAAKATVWQATWKPWGEAQSITGTAAMNLRFPGQYFQIETNFAYNHHRHYDPVTGRYTQPDPLGFVDGPSVYAYAGNSPFMRADRAGLEYNGPWSIQHGSVTGDLGHGGVIADGPGDIVNLFPPGTPIPDDWDVDFVCIGSKWVKLNGGTLGRGRGGIMQSMPFGTSKTQGNSGAEYWIREVMRKFPNEAKRCGCAAPANAP